MFYVIIYASDFIPAAIENMELTMANQIISAKRYQNKKYSLSLSLSGVK